MRPLLAAAALAGAVAGCASPEGGASRNEADVALFMDVAQDRFPGWSEGELLEDADTTCRALAEEPSEQGWVGQVKRLTDAGMGAEEAGFLIAVQVRALCPGVASALP